VYSGNIVHIRVSCSEGAGGSPKTAISPYRPSVWGSFSHQRQLLLSKIQTLFISGCVCSFEVVWYAHFVPGVLGIKVKIMLPHDATGKSGPKKPLPDQVEKNFHTELSFQHCLDHP